MIYIKKFRIVDMNIFEVWFIAIRSHFEGRSCVWNTEIFVFKTLFGSLRPQDSLVWKNDLHGLSSSRRNDRFWYKNRSNPSSYAKVRAIGIQPCQEAKTGAPHQTPCLMGNARDSQFCASYLTLKMTSDQKTFNIKVVRLIETVKISFGLVSIWDRLPPQKRPARCSQFKPNSIRNFRQNQSEFD